MGFFNTVGKLFMGEPLGPSAPAQGAPADASGQSQGNGLVSASGLKVTPDIEVEHTHSHRSGEHLIVTAVIHNESPDQIIRIDTSYLLKQKRQHNQEIGPGRSWELKLYEGPAPHDENEHTAQFIYRLKANGDVFMENYQIKYHLESDGTRIVDELHRVGPVRDI